MPHIRGQRAQIRRSSDITHEERKRFAAIDAVRGGKTVAEVSRLFGLPYLRLAEAVKAVGGG
jgi:hypothetical protein